MPGGGGKVRHVGFFMNARSVPDRIFCFFLYCIVFYVFFDEVALFSNIFILGPFDFIYIVSWILYEYLH